MTENASEPPALKPATQHWAIFGGGVLGIALAENLIAKGQRVTIIEAGPGVGGLASGWKVGEVEWDKYYHVILLSDSKLREMLARVGLEREIEWVTTRTGFYSGGQLYSMSNSVEFLKFPPLNLIEKIRLGGTIFYASRIKNWRPLENLKVTDWLRKLSGVGTFDKIWLPLLKAKLGSAYDRASAAFIWAYISRMYKARRSGLKTEMFGYVPGGYGRIMRALDQRLAELGVMVRGHSSVDQISKRSDGRFDVRLTDGDCLVFDRVIATTPAGAITRMCPDLNQREIELLSAIEYLGVVCVSMVLRQPLSPYYVTNITDQWVPMTAVIEMSTVVDPKQFGGNSLIYLPKYLPSEDGGLDESDELVIERFTAALEKMHPHFRREDVVATRVARAKKVMAIPTLGYSGKLPPVKTSVEGFYALNSAHIVSGTLNVNETIELADEKFAQVIWPDFSSSSLMDSNAAKVPHLRPAR